MFEPMSGLQDASGLTALHWAASRGREACVTSLLLKGSDPSCLTHTLDSNPGRTAADLASSAGHSGIAAFLSEASLVYALSTAPTGKPPASLVSLQGKLCFRSHLLLVAVSPVLVRSHSNCNLADVSLCVQRFG